MELGEKIYVEILVFICRPNSEKSIKFGLKWHIWVSIKRKVRFKFNFPIRIDQIKLKSFLISFTWELHILYVLILKNHLRILHIFVDIFGRNWWSRTITFWCLAFICLTVEKTQESNFICQNKLIIFLRNTSLYFDINCISNYF